MWPNGGPFPKAASTFPELNCHSVEDLEILNTRPMTPFKVAKQDIEIYRNEIIPFWQGRSMRDRVFDHVPKEWDNAYRSGMFTEFMEQRAPGHTSLDGIIYEKGMLDFKREIEDQLSRLDYLNDPDALEKAEELKAMAISCDAVIIFAERHAALAQEMADNEKNTDRIAELKEISRVCSRVPAHKPETLWRPFRCTGSFISEPLPS